jgi:pyroglutamyl-peptidase
VINLVPKLLPPANPLYPVPDIILHIGLAAGRSYFALETGSHAYGYTKISDVDGQRFEDSRFETLFPSSQFPSRLNTSFDTSDVLARWKANLGYTTIDGTHTDEGYPDVRVSEDAGNFLCGFIYYNSLVHYYSIKKDERPVVFLHVPDLSGSEDKLREGWEVTVGLIKALVESRRKVGWKVVDGERGDVEDEGAERTDNNFA